MINLKIQSINIRYGDNDSIERVEVNHNGFNEDRTLTNHGYITLTKEEYEGNESLTALEKIVRQRLSDEFTNAE